jgi:hypothetical protein
VSRHDALAKLKTRYRMREDRPIHDGDCAFWDVGICTCGLLHDLCPLVGDGIDAIYPDYAEEQAKHDAARDRLLFCRCKEGDAMSEPKRRMLDLIEQERRGLNARLDVLAELAAEVEKSVPEAAPLDSETQADLIEAARPFFDPLGATDYRFVERCTPYDDLVLKIECPSGQTDAIFTALGDYLGRVRERFGREIYLRTHVLWV